MWDDSEAVLFEMQQEQEIRQTRYLELGNSKDALERNRIV